jgi:poly-gamma-glutamate capsule biosynthesis protein CapA/YwtB (metallophosphatase superfamily)
MVVKIGFTGDFCPQGRIEELYHSGQWQPLFEQVKEVLDANDLNIVDLECPLVTNAKPIKKTGPLLKCSPETAEILDYLKVSLVATANNHFMDYGGGGLHSTFEALRSKNIAWVGSGDNQQEAAQIYYTEINGVSIAVINVAENEWSTTHGSTAGVNPIDPVNVFNQLQQAKQQADFTIVIAHGGNEHYNLPSPRVKELYRFFIDSGASAVVSHHTHTVSGYEVYNDSPIFYGLGNFCFDWPGSTGKPWNTGMVLQLIFETGKPVAFTKVFIKQNDKDPGLSILSAIEQAEWADKIKGLNKIIVDDNLLEASFKQYCQQQRGVYLAWLEPYAGKILPSLRKRKLLPSLLTVRKKRLYTNIIRCEAHRDVLLRILSKESKT